MAVERSNQVRVYLTCEEAKPRDIEWVLKCLDSESQKDVEGYDAIDATGSQIAWIQLGKMKRPIALFGVDNDPGNKGASAWMMTTEYLQHYKAHRVLVRTVRKVLGDTVASREYVWGKCRRRSPIIRLLNMIGAEFRFDKQDDEMCYWSLSINSKLWRTI